MLRHGQAGLDWFSPRLKIFVRDFFADWAREAGSLWKLLVCVTVRDGSACLRQGFFGSLWCKPGWLAQQLPVILWVSPPVSSAERTACGGTGSSSYRGSGDLNSGCSACVASALPAELSPQLESYFEWGWGGWVRIWLCSSCWPRINSSSLVGPECWGDSCEPPCLAWKLSFALTTSRSQSSGWAWREHGPALWRVVRLSLFP